MKNIPVVLLGHRKRDFLIDAVASLSRASGVGDLYIVDDSGDPKHHRWLDVENFQFSVVSTEGNAGYLQAMRKVWDVAREAADKAGTTSVLLWEEDFTLEKRVDLRVMDAILTDDPALAQLNLQRQAVYSVEKRFGYMESHMRRGYDLKPQGNHDLRWVRRRRPFTTNPGLIRREILDAEWPSRAECDRVDGGAEPAMSMLLEAHGWHFGWYGRWNSPVVRHNGVARKSGTGY